VNKKISIIRNTLGLTESDISSVLNISSYKYRNFEKGTLEIPMEIVVLISLAYEIPICYLIFDKYSSKTILELDSIIRLKHQNRVAILDTIKNNICRVNSYNYNSINYSVIKNVLKNVLKFFSDNLIEIRKDKSIEAVELATMLSMPEKEYSRLEEGIKFPNIYTLFKLSECLDVSVDELFFHSHKK